MTPEQLIFSDVSELLSSQKTTFIAGTVWPKGIDTETVHFVFG